MTRDLVYDLLLSLINASFTLQRRLGHPCESESQRFDPITQTCYEVGTRGPCGLLMMFTGNDYRPRRNQYLPTEFQNDKVYGHCECDRARYSDLLMVSIRGQCHFLYSQVLFCKK